MTAITFDTLEYSKTLQDAGIAAAQADALAKAQKKALDQMVAAKELATKMDLLQAKMELAEKMDAIKHDTIRWLIGIAFAQTALIVAVLAYVK
ncbi:MAG: hypothetical protein E7022_06690 [Desulfovibrio desulfuricans]|nr:hypothetical protein [Desulfovibrio desulfuricans]